MGHACLFFLTGARIPDRVATCNSGRVHGAHACLFFLTEAKIPDRVATQLRWSGCLLRSYVFHQTLCMLIIPHKASQAILNQLAVCKYNYTFMFVYITNSSFQSPCRHVRIAWIQWSQSNLNTRIWSIQEACGLLPVGVVMQTHTVECTFQSSPMLYSGKKG